MYVSHGCITTQESMSIWGIITKDKETLDEESLHAHRVFIIMKASCYTAFFRK